MGGGGSTTKNVWPKWAKQPMKRALRRAEGLFQSHSTPPGLNPYTTQALEGRAAMALGGNTVGHASGDEALRILRGEYLDPTKNPNFQRAIGAAMGAASDRFAGSGRVGSGAYAGALGDAATGVAGQMYDQERQRMLGTLAMAPQLQQVQYGDTAALEDAGRAYEDEASRQFLWPYEQLDRFSNIVYGNPGVTMPGQKTSTKFDVGQAAVGLGSAAIMACWVADELYGVGSGKAALARLYATTHDTPFLRLYKRHGRKWAAWLKEHAWAKAWVRPIWDAMAAAGARMVIRHA